MKVLCYIIENRLYPLYFNIPKGSLDTELYRRSLAVSDTLISLDNSVVEQILSSSFGSYKIIDSPERIELGEELRNYLLGIAKVIIVRVILLFTGDISIVPLSLTVMVLFSYLPIWYWKQEGANIVF